MRKLIGILIVAVVVALGFGIFNELAKSDGEFILKSPRPEAKASIIAPKITDVEIPAKISIPKLGVETKVEQVGLNKEMAMDIPKNENDTAWYSLGVKPGELGNAVIAGHFDKKDGSPSVFYKLNELEEGDEVLITDAENKVFKFKVVKSESYKLEEFPLKAVFGYHTKPRLNLITCEGVFDKKSRLYSNRFVVYSELED